MDKISIENILRMTGAVAVGVAKCEPVEESAWKAFMAWLKKGENAEMDYMANHQPIRRDPRLLLEGASSIISLAFPFAPERFRHPKHGMIACYAFGEDYHDALRKRLNIGIEKLKTLLGGEYRVCIDSAPIMERYWAVKSGIAARCLNGSVEVKGYGSMVFLAEIITTLPLPEFSCSLQDGKFLSPKQDSVFESCIGCQRCIAACPGGAIRPEGEVDSRRCLSYLSIEHRGEWRSPEALETMNTPAGRETIFGCDLCLRVCPLNKGLSPTPIPEFQARPEIMSLCREDVKEMTQEEFSKRFKGSPIKRAKLAGLLRNCRFV